MYTSRIEWVLALAALAGCYEPPSTDTPGDGGPRPSPGCASGNTSISGVVYDPAGRLPLPNVFVYVPNGPVPAIPTGASCERCTTPLATATLAKTVTDVNGRFTLTNVPEGDVPIVLQVGKWRRQFTVRSTKCMDTPAPATLTRLPRNRSEGNIPKIAVSVGSADNLECLLLRLGLDQAEFTNPDGPGRVNLYSASGSAGTAYAPSLGGAKFPLSSQLWGSHDPSPAATPPVYGLRGYDLILLGCEGSENTTNKPATARAAMQQYVDGGGRVLATHYHGLWLRLGPGAWPGLVSWKPTSGMLPSPTNLTVLTTHPGGELMSRWMQAVGAASASSPTSFPATDGRQSITGITDKSNITEWIAVAGESPPQYFTMNTPIGSGAAACGRFAFSDLHSSTKSGEAVFPSGCPVGATSPQEMALEYLLFDLSGRICDEKAPYPPPN